MTAIPTLPPTTERVPLHSAGRANERIAAETQARVRRYAEHPDEIDDRLRALDREWDIERTLEANAATASLVGVLLGASIDRRFYLLPGVVAAFLLQHAVQGWCPPLAVFRRRGVRTAREIEDERQALKALRGDYASVSEHTSSAARGFSALAAARR